MKAKATNLSRSVSGLGISELAEAFRLKPLLDDGSIGRQLREWADGMPKDAKTKRKIISRMCAVVLDDVKGPVDANVVREVTVKVLMHWCAWADAIVDADPQLASVWMVEHTVRLFGMVLGAVRHAWGVPWRQPTVEDWFPSASDEKSLPAAYVDDVFSELEKREGRKVTDLLAAVRIDDSGKATKADTVKRWRSGETQPNGERVGEIQRAVGDPRLRLLLGVRAVLERLAQTPNPETGEAPPVGQRNTTMVWMLHAETTASAVQRVFVDQRASRTAAIQWLADPAVLRGWLPALTSTPGPLPYDLQKVSAVVIDVRQGDRHGKIVVRLPEGVQGQVSVVVRPSDGTSPVG